MSQPQPRPAGEEEFWHAEKRVCAGCGATIEWEADCQFWWIDYGYGNPPPETFKCPDGSPHRPGPV